MKAIKNEPIFKTEGLIIREVKKGDGKNYP